MTLVFAIMHLYIYSFFIYFFLYFFKPGIDKSTEWSKIPACPSFMCLFNRGDTEGTHSSKNLCSMFVYVLFYVNCVRTDFVVFE